MTGTLILVATPIGNLGDLPPRAIAAMQQAQVLLCEDTRRTGNLCRHFGIDTPRLSYHDHNEHERTPEIVARLKAGQTVALVSDAGTPLVNDPGLTLVRAALAENVTVTAIPGPAAPIVALVVSGFPPVPCAFFGFPPPKAKGRLAFAAEVAAWPHTAICFVSPHRGADELAALAAAAGERPAVLARELTKTYETCHRDRLDRLAATLAAAPPKGEWTLVLGPKPASTDIDLTAIVAAALAAAAAGQSLKAACTELAARHAVPWRILYKLALAAGKGA